MMCCNCQCETDADRDNIVVVLYLQEPAYSHLMIACEHCGAVTRVVVDQDDIVRLMSMGYMTMRDGQPADDLKAKIDQLNEAESEVIQVADEPKTYELTPRLEAEIVHFAEVLANAPADLLMDVLTEPPPKSAMPARWINE